MEEVKVSPNSTPKTSVETEIASELSQVADPPEPDYSPPSEGSSLNQTSYFNLVSTIHDKHFHIKINNDQYNNILTSLVNGLRRTIITDIPTVSFDVESLSGFDNPKLRIITNRSKYHNDYLAHRISLIPVSITTFMKNLKTYNYYNIINSSNTIQMDVEDFDVSKLQFKINVSNTNNIMEKSIYVKTNDMKVYYDDNEISNEEYKFINPEIILAKLTPMKRETDIPESINLIATPSLGYGYMHTRWSPTSNIEYWFEEDEEKINQLTSSLSESENKRFRIEKSQRIYKGAENNIPMIYNIKYKSKGSVNNYYIFKESIRVLKEKINSYKNNLQSGENMKFTYETNAMNALDIITETAGHTVGNIIVEYARMHKGVDYIAYKVPHPLKKDMFVRVKPTLEYKEQSDLSEKDLTISIINEVCIHVINILKNLENEYNQIIEEEDEFQ